MLLRLENDKDQFFFGIKSQRVLETEEERKRTQRRED